MTNQIKSRVAKDNAACMHDTAGMMKIFQIYRKLGEETTRFPFLYTFFCKSRLSLGLIWVVICLVFHYRRLRRSRVWRERIFTIIKLLLFSFSARFPFQMFLLPFLYLASLLLPTNEEANFEDVIFIFIHFSQDDEASFFRISKILAEARSSEFRYFCVKFAIVVFQGFNWAF